ncbi:MAG TPA: sulfatase-like hydrolase/transferase [Parasegetibacter sp.]
MKKIIEKRLLFPFLLPVFFVIHGVNENFGFVPFKDALSLILLYTGAAILLYFISKFIFKNATKAAIFSWFVLAIYLFFGAIQDFMKYNDISLHRYSRLLPVLLILTIICFIWLKKSEKGIKKTVVFLNLLFLVYIGVETYGILKKTLFPETPAIHSGSASDAILTKADSLHRPDIYFLLFDEYSSSESLRSYYNYDNSELDSFLLNNGFSIQKFSRSNYNFTPFSMASIFNMNYLTGVEKPEAITLEDYNHCINLVKSNKVISFLRSEGYEIINNSVFDLDNHPSKVYETFLASKTRLITAGTLFTRIGKDLGWMLYAGRFKINRLADKLIYRNLRNNTYLIEQVKEEVTIKRKSPRFVYMHVYMPHTPFYFDRDGKLKDIATLQHGKDIKTVQGYLDYLPYTNSRIKEVIETIQANTDKKAVIILMSDHGFRKRENPKSPEDIHQMYFIQNAVYLPENYPNLFHDSVIAVNQFRILFNTLFNQQLPILNDSTIYLQDKVSN